MNNHIVPISTEIERFKEHLALENNIRILFSAPFGAGKSSFIQTFFSDNDEYLCIKIFPTSYSVASNKDIFELIKHDILTSLFEEFAKYIELGNEEFNNFLIGQMYALHQMDFYSLSQTLIKLFIPKAKPGVEITESIKDLFEKFSDYKKELNSTEEDSIIEYLTTLRMQAGSIKENDFFTRKIREYLNVIREKSKKRILLVIDDLDRLDADHVFRIFNIFTAHYDSKADSNKFGFDKIILVCDINTIEHLFFHRYGSKAEFDGYIDKFYSQFVYYFDNKKHLIDNISKLLFSKDKLSKNYGNQSLSNDFVYSYSFKDSTFYKVFHHIIADLIGINSIKIRNFQRFQEYSLPNITLRHPDRGSFSSDNFHFIVLVHLLAQFFPRSVDLEIALKELYESFPDDYSVDKKSYHDSKPIDLLFINYSLPFLGAIDITSNGTKEDKLEFASEHEKKMFVLFRENHTTADGGIEYLRCISKVDQTTNDGKIEGPIVTRPNPYWFIYQAFQGCKRRKYKLRLNQFG